ncbi:MAG: transglycosylase SLT domain-containing protein [Thermoleophilaceae bacterium]|nr:transglycosylase SLT domain-containing protein [Thermoleophilaceae bacterium]
MRKQSGQAVVILVATVAAMMVATVVFAGAGGAYVARGRLQRTADAAALSAARQMKLDYSRLFEPRLLASGVLNTRWMSSVTYKQRARLRARLALKANGFGRRRVTFGFHPSLLPTSVTVQIGATHKVKIAGVAGSSRLDDHVQLRALSQASLRFAFSGEWLASSASASGGGYEGPLVYRQGKPMRPDTAAAFDKLDLAASNAGINLVITSAFRSDAEQQRLWNQRPDPHWVAPPGTSLHRYGTELDLGPVAAYSWLASNAISFGFIHRYAWEPWHYGFGKNPRDVPAQYERGSWEPPDGRFDSGKHGMPPFVPPRYAPMIARAALHWNVAAELIAAQLQAESGFNPLASSPAGALGIAQFMPATARTYGLSDPFDPAAAIDAQAHLMSDLIKQFGHVELALAAYNAGAGAVEHYGGMPPYGETRAYVARILALLNGSAAALQIPQMGLSAVVSGVELVR